MIWQRYPDGFFKIVLVFGSLIPLRISSNKPSVLGCEIVLLVEISMSTYPTNSIMYLGIRIRKEISIENNSNHQHELN
jgi:hypothetical protein